MSKSALLSYSQSSLIFNLNPMIQLDHAALQARNQLLAMFLLLCLLDITLVILARDGWAIGRIIFTILVMYFVIQGRLWAKWLLVAICGLLVVALMAMILTLGAKLSTILIAGSGIMIALCILIPIYMTNNKNLKRYFAYQRQQIESR
ncbi:MAG: hypothetical protein MUF72_23220 [Elainella sp. Prado103]|nr:hypothetical protein [Elainella sp. Prado103]